MARAGIGTRRFRLDDPMDLPEDRCAGCDRSTCECDVSDAAIEIEAMTLLRKHGFAPAVLLVGAVLATAARARCELEAFEIPVAISGLRALATIRVNGTEARFVVDSGAFFSSITEAGAAQLGLAVKPAPEPLRRILGLTGAADMRMTTVERLGLAGSEMKDFEFLVGGNEPGEGALGLLGRNVLTYTDTEYDLPHGAIRLMRPNDQCGASSLAYWSGPTPVRWPGPAPVAELELRQVPGERFPSIRAIVRIAGEAVTAEFDSGARSILSLSAARGIGIVGDTKDLEPADPVIGAGLAVLPSWTVSVGTVEIGQERIADGRLRVADFKIGQVEMLVGIDFFLTHRIYVSVPRRRIYFTYTGGAMFDLTKAAAPAAPADDAGEPVDAAAYARRGMARAAHGDLERALADLDRACELGPGVALHWRERSVVRARLKREPEALADADEALRRDPSDVDARLQRIRLLGSGGRFDRLRTDVAMLDRQLAPQADMRRVLGEIEVRLGDLAAAIAQYDRWLEAHANDVDIHQVLQQRCWARALLGRELDQALADCDRAVAGRPKEAAFVGSRGVVHLRRGEWREAVVDFDAALDADPQLAWSRLGRGIARLRLGDRDAGRADIAAARALRPGIVDEARRHGIQPP